MVVVRSVEWLSTTITLNGNGASWASALCTACITVRSRLRTGMTTDASTGNGSRLVNSRKGGRRRAPIRSRWSVATRSASTCNARPAVR